MGHALATSIPTSGADLLCAVCVSVCVYVCACVQTPPPRPLPFHPPKHSQGLVRLHVQLGDPYRSSIHYYSPLVHGRLLHFATFFCAVVAVQPGSTHGLVDR